MKKIFCTLILFTLINNVKGQERYPQLWFYSSSSIISNDCKNDVEEHDETRFRILLGKIFNEYSDKQMIDMLYRVYEIEATSEIKYSTLFNYRLKFQCKDSLTNFQKVDFGADLIANQKTDSVYRLRFGSPVKVIDPAIFAYNVTKIILPATSDLTYCSSPNMRVDVLQYIAGKDVVENRALISKDNTLIASAGANAYCFEIPENVKKIGAGAFRGSKLTAVIIPQAVTYIGEKAFDLSEIKYLIINSENILKFAENTFGDEGNNEIVFLVPQDLVKEYKNTYPTQKKRFLAMERNEAVILYYKALQLFDKKKYKEAVDMLKEASSNGSSDADYQLGDMYFWGNGVKEDLKISYSYYEKAAKKKHVDAMYKCSFYPIYASDPVDLKTAIKWLKLAVKYNHEFAARDLGDIYSDADYRGFPLNLQEALKSYKKALEKMDGNIYLEEKIKRVEMLIKCDADNYMSIRTDDMAKFDSNDTARFLLDYFCNKKFCLYDMVIALMKKNDVNENQALQVCKQIVEEWRKIGIVAK